MFERISREIIEEFSDTSDELYHNGGHSSPLNKLPREPESRLRFRLLRPVHEVTSDFHLLTGPKETSLADANSTHQQQRSHQQTLKDSGNGN